MMRRLLALPLLALLMLACNAASGSPDKAASGSQASRRPALAPAELDSLRARFMRAYNGRDAAALAALYAPDATLVGSSGAVVKGRPAIAQGYGTALAVASAFTMNPEETGMDGALAYERGAYTQRLALPGRPPEAVRGTYLLVARADSGAWLIHAHTVSREPTAR